MTQWNGLKRSPLPRRGSLARGSKPIPKLGRRGKRVMRGSKAVYGRFVAEARTCGRCGTAGDDFNPLEIHHLLPKSSGREQLSPENLVRLCRVHHQWAHNNPIAAREQGWLISRYERSRE